MARALTTVQSISMSKVMALTRASPFAMTALSYGQARITTPGAMNFHS